MEVDQAKREEQRTSLLRMILAVSLIFTAFWLYDFCQLHIGGFIDEAWQVLAHPMAIATIAWMIFSSIMSLELTDRRNFIYLPAILASNFLAIVASLHAHY